MRCPSKHNTVLISHLTTQGVEVDYCTECGGIWLDKGELFYFVRNPKLALKKFLFALEHKKPSDKISPKSLKPMVEIEYPDGPTIDYCEESGGIWLDKNELEENSFDAIFNISKVHLGVVKSIITFVFLKVSLVFCKIFLPSIFLFNFLLSVRATILKLLFFLTDLIICWPIRPKHPVIPKLIFFIRR